MNGAEQKNQQTTPSDLVYLFVDGEATDLERTMLFAALAEDVELQGELGDAIRVNSAARQESLETLPPPAVTANLFRRAGVVGAASHVIPPVIPPAGPPTPTGMSPDRGPVALGLRAEEEKNRRRWGGLLFPVGGAVVGVLLTLLLLGDPKVETVSDGGAFAEKTGSTEQSVSLTTAPPASSHTPATVSSAGGASVRNDQARLQRTSARIHNPVVTPSFDATTEVEAASEAASEAVTETASESVTESPAPPPTAINRLAELNLKPDELRQLMAETSEPKASESIEFQDEIGEEFKVESPNYSIFLRGAGTLGTWPPREGEATVDRSLADAFALGGLYHLDETHAIGLQGGRDHHPFYLINDRSGERVVRSSVNPDVSTVKGPNAVTYLGGGGTGRGPAVTTSEEIDDLSNLPGNPGGRNTNFVEQGNTENLADRKVASPDYRVDPTLDWVGVSYRLKGSRIDFLDEVRPIAQGTFGLSTVGPLGRVSLGLSWKPDDRVSLTAGVEGRALFYQRGDAWYSSRQLGLEYGIEVDL